MNFEEIYLFANEGENHTNNVKQLEEMKKGTEDTDRTFGSLNLLVIRTSSQAENLKLQPDFQALKIFNPLGMHHIGADRNGAFLAEIHWYIFTWLEDWSFLIRL